MAAGSSGRRHANWTDTTRSISGAAGGDDPAAFLYFFGFFRRAAFDPGPLAFQTLLQASRYYAAAVGDTLKAQVYEALRHLAQGFLDYAPNGLQPDPPTLKAVYDHSLILLYRLLFIFYAEARGLLPFRANASYRDSYSLYAITHQVAHSLGLGQHLLPTSATLWPRLREVFGIINAGSPPLQVATFNGGLFDPGRYPFLEQSAVGDAHLQQALDRLARVEDQFIDYRDLAEPPWAPSTRDCSSITWSRLRKSSMANCKADGRDQWTVDLVNDKGERQATGSYYTPDYIVK